MGDNRVKPTEDTWVTKEGEAILVKDMSDSHLVNTVKMLLRQIPRLRDHHILEGEIALSQVHGEMAQLCIERDINHLDAMDDEEFLEYCHPTGEALLEELEERNLLDGIYYKGGDS